MARQRRQLFTAFTFENEKLYERFDTSHFIQMVTTYAKNSTLCVIWSAPSRPHDALVFLCQVLKQLGCVCRSCSLVETFNWLTFVQAKL